jgi:hypothetical protein
MAYDRPRHLAVANGYWVVHNGWKGVSSPDSSMAFKKKILAVGAILAGDLP